LKRLLVFGVSALSALCLAQAALAQSVANPGRFSLGLGVGTNGVVAEGAYQLAPQLVLRAQGAFLDFNYGFKSNDVAYGGRFHFNTGGGFADWHPGANPWLLTAGAITGERYVNVSAKPAVSGSITIHGVSYPVTEVGSVTGRINYGATVPVAGVGWDNTFYSRRGWGFRAIAGVAIGDHPPHTTLHANGPYATQPTVITDVAAEQVSLQHQAADYSYYPVVQVGVNYRF